MASGLDGKARDLGPGGSKMLRAAPGTQRQAEHRAQQVEQCLTIGEKAGTAFCNPKR